MHINAMSSWDSCNSNPTPKVTSLNSDEPVCIISVCLVLCSSLDYTEDSSFRISFLCHCKKQTSLEVSIRVF